MATKKAETAPKKAAPKTEPTPDPDERVAAANAAYEAAAREVEAANTARQQRDNVVREGRATKVAEEEGGES